MLTDRQTKAINKVFDSNFAAYQGSMNYHQAEWPNVGSLFHDLQAGQAALEIDVAALQDQAPGVPNVKSLSLSASSIDAGYSLFNLPANSAISLVSVKVNVPFDNEATLSIGTNIENSKFMSANENDLKESFTFTTTPTDIVQTLTPVIVYFNKNSSTVGSVDIEVYYA